MTQKRLADLVGVSQAAIAQIEASAFVASDELAEAIAKHTGQTIAFLTKESGPEFPLGSLLFRSHASLSKKEMLSACRHAERVYELCAYLRKRTRAIPVKIPALNGIEPRRAAQEMRKHLGLSASEPVPHLLNILEWNGAVVLSIPPEKSRDAFSFWYETFPIIAVSREAPGDRGRMNVAHELAHLSLHPNKSRLEVDDTEADEFAAEFLMPESAIGKEIKSPVTLSALAPLKARWRVSIQALIRRAKDLSLITARQYRYLFEQLSYMGWRTKEPIEIENEKPRALRQMAEMIYGEPIDFERMAHESAIKAHELREIIGGYMPRVDQTPKFDSKVVTLPRQKR